MQDLCGTYYRLWVVVLCNNLDKSNLTEHDVSFA